MVNDLRVVSAAGLASAPCLLEVDEYVPLRFRSYERPLGSGYIELGNRSTSLLELIVDPNAGTLRGVTITLYASISAWPAFHVASVSEGVPVLSPTLGPRRGIHLDEDFRVAVRGAEILVFWGDLAEATSEPARCEALSYSQRVQFLIRNSLLSGILFSEMSLDSMSRFVKHAEQQKQE